jgi:hypothetical protein
LNDKLSNLNNLDLSNLGANQKLILKLSLADSNSTIKAAGHISSIDLSGLTISTYRLSTASNLTDSLIYISQGSASYTLTLSGQLPSAFTVSGAALTPSYLLTPASSTMNEGASDNVTLQTTNLTAGSTVTYAISGIAASRLSNGLLTGTLTIDSNGRAIIPFAVLNDNFTDGTTVATITVGANLASTAITINDTSLTPVVTQLTPVLIASTTKTYTVTTPNLAITGTSGNDTVAFSGSHSNFSVSIASGKATVVDKTGALGMDTLTSVERIKFSDGVYALDIAPGQNAGQAYRLYQAAFARTPDMSGVKYHLNDMESNGLPLWQIASNFLASPEFASKYGQNPADTQYINALYNNVLKRTPGGSEVAWYQNQFNTKAMDRQAALIGFSESPENVALVGSAIANGIWLG